MFKKIPALMLLCAIPWIIGMTKPVRAEYIGISELQTEANIEWKKDYVDEGHKQIEGFIVAEQL